jgi:type II secretory pathway pseudopilin PulG
MIKFFRRIRQNLIAQDKFSKYLLYAIGEIVLVVIGILIALSINNLNEDRKKRDLELSTLAELKSNLLADIKDFQGDMRVYDIASNSSDIIIDYIDGNIPFHDSLYIHLGKIPVQGVFAPNKAAYENLKVIGIKLISNDSLRAAISDLYEGRYLYVQKYLETEYQVDRQKFGDFYLKEMEEYSFFKYAKPIDNTRLLGNQEFRNLIMHRKLKINGWFNAQYELNIRKASHLIELIELELKE